MALSYFFSFFSPAILELDCPELQEVFCLTHCEQDLRRLWSLAGFYHVWLRHKRWMAARPKGQREGEVVAS